MKISIMALTICTLATLVNGCGKSQPPGPITTPVSSKKFIGSQPRQTIVKSENSPKESAARITASQAILKATQAVKGSDWRVTSLRNIEEVVTALFPNREPEAKLRRTDRGLMHKDGKAAMWQVSLISPSKNGKESLLRNNRTVFVTAEQTSVSEPEASHENVQRLPKSLNTKNLDAARQLIIKQNKGDFDLLSVTSELNLDGTESWFFWLFDSKSQTIVDKVRVSGDGSKVLQSGS